MPISSRLTFKAEGLTLYRFALKLPLRSLPFAVRWNTVSEPSSSLCYDTLKFILTDFRESRHPYPKMPLKSSLYLKSNTLRSRKSKRREPLSANMISQPLGDFRHLSHIGMDTQGDVFGDLSFLKRVNSLPNESSLSTLGLGPDDILPPPKPPRLEPGQDAEPQVLHGKQRHKKCHSLPLLDSIDADELTSGEGPPDFVTEREAELTQDPPSELSESPAPEDDSPFSLNLDLGPSILDDVLRVMDKLSQ
ncbi:hypothetical protein SKAU_G00191130 [Synaphobranchus kaupii]|uniref:CRIB domain-containing protein n=1 Tax=Synaphobranchus kaupii TaxID=118154 RepID=A0A9Q1IWD0_SYNKA|nr:hypothetical protein SKAU_G00191130 [Synaphobranchus kaupii]